MENRLKQYEHEVATFIADAPEEAVDRALWKKVVADTRRTRHSCLLGAEFSFLHEKSRNPATLDKLAQPYDQLSRILYLYAKKNPAIGYCQGMNEIAATFLLGFST